ncbi:MAG: pre-toxin TG domain-containing protein, partial [Bacillota bacterium]|nr:pre-toxin TG domain-containing protein [Bacillota bacterium]
METKRITPAFADKALAGGCTAASIECTLNNIEEIFTECNEELAAMEMAKIGYSFQADEISRVAENMVKLQIYVGSAHPQVYDELDFPLYKDFKNHATETLSQIVLSDLSTDNTFGMEEHYKVSGRGETYTVKRVKSKITMEDFLGLEEISEEDGIPILEHVETIGEFATLFRLDYDTMKMEDKDINACIEAYMTAGEYDHKAYHPVKDFLSGLLDMTIIKPLVECVTGKDLITGECLTETEKGWKLIGACIDLFTFGQGALAIKGAGLAGKQALKTIGR